ncbi:MAG: helix-turn-helix domain-containing protein [Phycisphaerales bacterium]
MVLAPPVRPRPHPHAQARFRFLRGSSRGPSDGAGTTQEALGAAAGSSQRMIAHYENSPGAKPPADVLAALARALGGSADALLGLEPTSEHVSAATYRLPKRLRKVEDLPPDDQKTVVNSSRRSLPAARSRPAGRCGKARPLRRRAGLGRARVAVGQSAGSPASLRASDNPRINPSISGMW